MKREIYLKTFVGRTPDEADKLVNEFKKTKKVVGTHTNIIQNPINTAELLFIYTTFYEEWI